MLEPYRHLGDVTDGRTLLHFVRGTMYLGVPPDTVAQLDGPLVLLRAGDEEGAVVALRDIVANGLELGRTDIPFGNATAEPTQFAIAIARAMVHGYRDSQGSLNVRLLELGGRRFITASPQEAQVLWAGAEFPPLWPYARWVLDQVEADWIQAIAAAPAVFTRHLSEGLAYQWAEPHLMPTHTWPFTADARASRGGARDPLSPCFELAAEQTVAILQDVLADTIYSTPTATESRVVSEAFGLDGLAATIFESYMATNHSTLTVGALVDMALASAKEP